MSRILLAVSVLVASAVLAPAQTVVASFTSTIIVTPIVQFTDTSTGSPTTWAWDFDSDGNVDDTSSNPVWVYPGPGAYLCTLTVTNATSSDTVAAAVGIETINLPAFTSTYTQSTHTRGMWFQAPARFSIVGLRVPDESGFGLQNVAVYRMANAPPTFSASATGGLEFLSLAIPSNENIPCAVSFDTGDYVGVLGACGDNTTMRNSYGSGPFVSSVLGLPVSLTRFMTQTNLVSANGLGPYSGIASGSIARVEMAVSACVGLPYGDGSPSSQAAAPTLKTTALPFLGQTAELTIENFDSNALGVIGVGLGRLNQPTPIGTLLINNFAGSAILNGGAPMNPGSYTFSFRSPPTPRCKDSAQSNGRRPTC